MNDKIKFITSIFGTSRLQNNGIELMIPCPFCKDTKKLKMNIRLDSDLYHCWVCNSKGRNLGRLIKQKKPSKVAQYFEKFGKNFAYNLEAITEDEVLVELPEGFRHTAILGDIRILIFGGTGSGIQTSGNIDVGY